MSFARNFDAGMRSRRARLGRYSVRSKYYRVAADIKQKNATVSAILRNCEQDAYTWDIDGSKRDDIISELAAIRQSCGIYDLATTAKFGEHISLWVTATDRLAAILVAKGCRYYGGKRTPWV